MVLSFERSSAVPCPALRQRRLVTRGCRPGIVAIAYLGLIRRAALKTGLGVKDPTEYTVESLRAQTLATDRVEGEHVRSFQLMVKRIQKAPELAKIFVHKPGPLIDAPDEIPDYVRRIPSWNL